MAKLLCVYCASSDRLDPKYTAAATELGHELVARGWGLVYGGGKTGLMGAVARAVKAKGGRVVGVIPEFMKARELAFDEADELVTVVTMRERKLLMEARADAFVTLPGGWGTLEEIMEILTLRQLDVVKKALRVPEPGRVLRRPAAAVRADAARQVFQGVEHGAVPGGEDRAGDFRQIDAAAGAKAESKWFETR